ncbi:hypothetical protein GGR55DRAFT_699354 [Xylaria sp. FL0064]|nr:hypothetical protein GGR55DRAFT_699354 [Xylaria sp. FL0064]
MDPSTMDFTMHHANHHHPHYHHLPNGGSSSASTSRCPAVRAAAEQRGYPLSHFPSTRATPQYDPVHAHAQAHAHAHAHAHNHNTWQSRSPQNWRPAMITPIPQVTPSEPTPSHLQQQSQPQPQCPMPNIMNMADMAEPYLPQISDFQPFRPTMHPAPTTPFFNPPSFEVPGGFPGSNPSQSNTQGPPQRPAQRPGLPSAASLLTVQARHPVPPRPMGQVAAFSDENSRPGQRFSVSFQNAYASPSSQPPEPIPQATTSVDEGRSRPTVPSPPTPASTAAHRTVEQQPYRMINPVEIRRASTAGMGRPRRSLSRYTGSPPSEWLNDGGNVVFRRGDATLMEFVDNFQATISDGEGGPVTSRFVRGAPAKRVASKKALASLESVSITDLPESERTCVICYNDFGVANPEGVNEAPLRLPKCKHVFGDHCIKKWFQESDSCPYCRDKVHSEYQHMPMRRVHPGFRFIPSYQVSQLTTQNLPGHQGREQGRSRDRDTSQLESPSTQPGQPTVTNNSDRPSQFADMLSNRPPSGSGRFESTTRPPMRLPSWNFAHERRSPPIENDRRRRPRHRARVSPPSIRSAFGGQSSIGVSQNSVRPSRRSRSRSPFDPANTGVVDSSSRRSLTNSPEQHYWNGSPSPNSTTGAAVGNSQGDPIFEASNFPLHGHFYPGVVLPNPNETPANEHSSGLAQMHSEPVRFSSPSTSSGSSDVYMADVGHMTSNQFTSYQQS